MLTIRNLTKRTLVFNLAHEFACSATVCTCGRMKVGVQEHDKRTGERRVRAVHQRLAASITLFPKGTRSDDGKRAIDQAEGLLVNVARVPEIQAAKARGEIEIKVVAEKKAEAPPGAKGAPKAPTPKALEPFPTSQAASKASKE